MDVKVKIDNEEVIFPQDDQQPFINQDNNRTYIPIRFPFEKMGFNVDWIDRTVDNPKGTVVITNHNKGVVFDDSLIKSKCYETTIKEDDTIFKTNNIPYEFYYEMPIIVGGRTMIPLRNIFETIDCLVDWDSNNSTAVIYSLENNYRIKDLDGNYLTYSSVDNNTPITVEKKKNNSESQIWGIKRSSEYHRHHIMTSLNTARAMNIYRADNTCTVYDISGNVQDTSLLIQSVDNGETVGDCYIKWVDGITIRYLSKKVVDGKTTVCWEIVPFDEEPQHWILELASDSNNQESTPTDIEGYYKIKNDSGYITYSVSESSQKPTASNTILSVNAGNLDNANLQIWKIEKNTNSNKYFIRPALSTYLGMNVYGISNNPCTLQPTSTYPDDTSFSIEYVENQGYLIFWENNNVRYYLAEGNGTIGESGKVYWQAGTQYLWTLEPTSYTPPPVDDTKSYPVAGIVHQGTTYVGHQPDSRDFAAPAGTAIYATMAGIVTDVVMKYSNDYNYNSSTGISTGGATSEICDKMPSYGNYVMIKVDCDKSILIFAHQQQNSYVKINDRVSVGQQIGEVGNTGVSTGSHLHFQVRKKETEENTVLDYFLWDY